MNKTTRKTAALMLRFLSSASRFTPPQSDSPSDSRKSLETNEEPRI
jgi:hypothetical protein